MLFNTSGRSLGVPFCLPAPIPMIQVARNGQVILELASEDELRAEIAAGNVLPTDHYIVVGMPSWRLVSALPDQPMASFARPEPDLEAITSNQVAQARAQILQLVQARPFPKPSKCQQCEGADLRSARLVWQQSTRVGGAIDTNFDLTVFGSSSLQAFDLTPPPEPKLPEERSGGCVTMFVCFIVFAFTFDAIMLPILLIDEYRTGKAALMEDPSLLVRAGTLLLLALAGYVAFRAARAVYRWDKRRSGKTIDGDCAVQLDRARVYARWRNTWICTSCGGRTVVVE